MGHSNLYAFADAGGSPGNATQYYFPVSGAIKLGTVEANFQIPTRTAGTLSRLCMIMTGAPTNACTGKDRIATADGTMSVSCNASGTFTDSTHTDSISLGNQIDVSYLTGAAGALLPISSAMTFLANSGTSLATMCGALLGGTNIGSNTTQYFGIVGRLLSSTTDGNPGSRFTEAGTAKNLMLDIVSNASVLTGTYALRKNSTTTTAVTIAVAGGTTGQVEDTTHTDTAVANDSYYGIKSGGTSGSSVLVQSTGLWFDYTSGTTSDILGGTVNSGGAQYSQSTGNRFMAMAGATPNSATTEANEQLQIGYAATWSNLRARVLTSTTAQATTCSSRIAGVTGNQAFTITAAGTGSFEDASHTDSVSQGNLLSFLLVGATGASGNAFLVEITSETSESTDANPAATAVTATGSAGTVVPEIDRALTGASATGSANSVTPEIDAAAVSVTATGAAAVVGASNVLGGVAATGAAAAVSIEVDSNVDLTGVTATGAAAGPLSITIAVPAASVFAVGLANNTRGFAPVHADLPVRSIMRNRAVPAIGLMGNTAVVCIGKLLPSGPQPKSVAIDIVGVAATGSVRHVTPFFNVLVRPLGVTAQAVASDCVATIT